MNFFAIRHIPSGGFLPALNSYGFTHAEPSRADPPRLFKQKRNATQALKWWLDGRVMTSYNDADLGGGDSILRSLPAPGRISTDMEIVEVKLQFFTLEQAQLERL